MRTLYLLSGLYFLGLVSCSQSDKGPLPKYGVYELSGEDTLYHRIRDFRFIDQDSQWITNETFSNQIYISDFFFTSCPTICPKVKQQMLRIYEHYENEPRLRFVSHSIDFKRDSVPVLKKYADKLGITSDRWHLVTGAKNEIYEIAEDYFSIALEDANAPGGYDHSGYIILIDPNRHIRAFCDGTDPDEVDKFMKDIDKLLNEL